MLNLTSEMGSCKCFSVFIGRKNANKVKTLNFCILLLCTEVCNCINDVWIDFSFIWITSFRWKNKIRKRGLVACLPN